MKFRATVDHTVTDSLWDKVFKKAVLEREFEYLGYTMSTCNKADLERIKARQLAADYEIKKISVDDCDPLNKKIEAARIEVLSYLKDKLKGFDDI